MLRIETIDAHTAGEPLRLIVSGFPAVEGTTVLEQREFVRANYDHVRQALMLEPRGHADMYGALLTPPEREGSDAGVLFMHNEGFSTMCGHGVIAIGTIVVERNLIPLPRQADGSVRITLDSPAGRIDAVARTAPVAQDFSPASARVTSPSLRVTSVSFRNVPSFVLHPSVPIRIGNREVLVDVAFGGEFYAIVDSESVGIPAVPQRLGDLRRVGMEIKEAVERAVTVAHPVEPQLHGISGTIFTGQASDPFSDLRNVTVFADGGVDRSPCGTGTAAVMAVLAAMGILGPGQQFTHESIIGTKFRGRVVGETSVSIPNSSTPNSQGTDIPAIIAEIEGEAHITGEHTFIIDERDPLRHGFRL
jgi:proline racemase